MIDYNKLEEAIKQWVRATDGWVTEKAITFWANQVGGSYDEEAIIASINHLAGRKIKPHLDRLKDTLEHGIPTEKKVIKFKQADEEEEDNKPEIPHLELEDKQWNIQFDRKWKNIMSMTCDKTRNSHILNILCKEGKERAKEKNDQEAVKLWEDYEKELEAKEEGG